MAFQATDHKGRTYRAPDPNEAGALALDASHSSKRDTLVCVERETESGSPYVVPCGYFTRDMHKRWRTEHPRT